MSILAFKIISISMLSVMLIIQGAITFIPPIILIMDERKKRNARASK